MYDIRLEKAKLVALQESCKRLKDKRQTLSPCNVTYGMLMCKEEDTRVQIADLQFLIARQENEMCKTCDGSRSIKQPLGNHSTTHANVPCPDCFPEGVLATKA